MAQLSPLSPPAPARPNFSDLQRIKRIGKDSDGSTIYTVAHRLTGELFSLKVISYLKDQYNYSGRQIFREIETFLRVNHPNVVKCLGVNHLPESREIHVLLDHVGGETLEGYHVPDEPSLADLTLQILSGLSYFHGREIAHSNIKPSNLLIDSTGQVKLSDFVSPLISSDLLMIAYMSSSMIAYMSPERINPDRANDRYASDIWGLGLSILELYLGRYPIGVDDLKGEWAQMVFSIVKKPPPEAPPTASTEFRDFIGCCLQRDPANRWTAQRLLEHPFILVNTRSGGDRNKLRQSLKLRATTTRFFTTNSNVFRQKMIEITGMHTMETPHQTVDVIAEAVTKTMEQIVKQQTIDPSPPRIEVSDEAAWAIDIHLKSCILYCSLFPVGYEFEKDRLVQLWIAEGLIKAEENNRMEDVGSLFFDYMSKWEFLVPHGFDHFGNQETYKAGEAMTSIFERETLAPLYCRVEDSHLADVSALSTHLSFVCDYIDEITFEALKQCRNLRTLLFLGHYGSSVKQVPRDLFLGLKLLTVLDFSFTRLSELPSSIGNLKSLHYLDVSETCLKRLPESVDCLHNLQTLRLRGCLDLVALPKYISKLVNLRHLDLDIARQLRSMPAGMGNLTSLQTLRTFLVGRDDRCRIGELKNMNSLSGSLCIWRLENVLNKEEAKVAALSTKQYLNKLELRWGDLRDEKADIEEEILECLQPYFGLRELQILCYRGSILPSWISSPSFVNMASITLYKCTNCYLLPSIGLLPSLQSLTLVQMNRVRDINRLFCRARASQGYQAFPKLEKLTFDVMYNLEEWTGVENGDFPCILQLKIKYCPKLISLPLLSLLNSLQYLEISHCPELSSFPEAGLPVSLGCLMVRDCPTLKERCQKGEGEDWIKIAHVPSIWIDHQEISLN